MLQQRKGKRFSKFSRTVKTDSFLPNYTSNLIRELEQRLAFEKIVTNISTRFVSHEHDQLNEMINISLKEIGEHTRIDRSYVFLYSADGQYTSNINEWCAPGISAEIENLQDLPTCAIPWWINQCNNNEIIYLHQLSDLPAVATAEKEILEAQGILSLLVVPIVHSNRTIGFIGFDSVRQVKSWSDTDIRLLRMVAEIFGATFKAIDANRLLQKSEEQYRILLENTGTAILTIDEKGTYHYANAYALLQIGVTEKEMVGKNVSDLFSAEFARQRMEIIRKVIQTHHRETIVEAIFINGEKRWFSTRFLPIIENNVFVSKVMLVMDDITEEKNSSLKLERYNERLRGLHKIDRAILEQLENNESVNSVALSYLSELVPCTTIALILFDHQQQLGSLFAVISEGKKLTIDAPTAPISTFNSLLLNGTETIHHPFHPNNLPESFQRFIFTADHSSTLALTMAIAGEAMGLLILHSPTEGEFYPEDIEIANDVARQMTIGLNQQILNERIRGYNDRLEELVRLRTQEKEKLTAMNEAIIKSSDVIIISVSPEGIILSINPAGENLLEYRAEELINRMSILDLHDPEELIQIKEATEKQEHQHFDSIFDAIQYNYKNRNVHSREHLLITKSGKKLPVLLTINEAKYSDDQPTCHVGIALDITERKKAEELQKTTLLQLNTLIGNMNIGILFADNTNHIALINQSFCSIFALQLPPDQMIGLKCTEAGKLISQMVDQPAQFISRINQIIRQGETVLNEEIYFTNGRVYVRDFLPIIHQGEKLGYLWQYRDITQRKLIEKYRYIQRDLAFSLGSTYDLQEALDLVMKAAFRVTGIDCGGIYLLNKETGHLNMMIHHGLSSEFVNQVSHYDPGTRETQIVQTGKAFYEDFKKFNPTFEAERKEGLKFMAVFPIKHENTIIGSLNLGAHRPIELNEKEKITFESIAAQIGGTFARIKILNELQASQHNLQLVFDTIQDILLIVDLDCKILKTNASIETVLGYRDEELHGVSVFKIIPPDMKEEAEKTRKEILANGTAVCSIPMCTKSGEVIPIETKLVVGKWDGNKAIYGLSRDISERLQAEQTLRKSEARWQFALESSGDGIWDWEFPTGKIFLSDQWKKMLGYHESQNFTQLSDWIELIHPDDLPQARVDLQQHFNGETPLFQNEQRLRSADGSYRWILIRGKIISRDSNGNPERIIGTNTDITQRKEYEDSLAEALKYEKELNELKSRFVSMASHEFRTPLASILVAADSLKSYRIKMSETEIGKKLSSIKNNVGYLKDIIEKVMNLSNLESGQIKFDPVDTPLVEFLSLVIEEYSALPHLKHPILFRKPDFEIELPIDQNMARQVFYNLITNGMKYSPNGAELIIGIEKTDTEVKISFSDKGIGIPVQDSDYIFDPFYRGSNIGNIHGTGIGLALSKQIIERHGGKIHFTTQLNIGTTFVVTLPLNR